MNKNRIFTIFFLVISTSIFSQDIKYARKVIDTLCSPYMGGRGYVDDGMHRAADYINHEFETIQLKKFTKDYTQNFDIHVNTFPSEMLVKIDGNELVPGIDFLVSSSSTGIKGEFGVEWLNPAWIKDENKIKEFARKDFTDKVLIVELSNNLKDTAIANFYQQLRTENIFHVAAVFFTTDAESLSWDCSGALQPFDFLLVDVKKNKIDLSAKRIKINIKNKYYKTYPVQNIIGYSVGEKPDSFIVFTAHYDHLGKMGANAMFPGAHDNASGISMMLDLAKYFNMPEHKQKYSIAFMAFCCEEAGLIGSWYYTTHPLFPLGKIKFLINLDILGTGSEGIQIVNSVNHKNEFEKIKAINNEKKYVADVKPRGNAADSDHYFFTQKNVPAIFIYTLGKEYGEYHTVNDKPKDLPLTVYYPLFLLIKDFIQSY